MSLARIEKQLGALVQRDHARLTGRATTALTILFKLLREATTDCDKILMPAIMCPHPAYAARLAGCTTVFVDVDPIDGTMCPSALAAALAENPDTVAILVVHTFGHPSNMTAIGALAQQYDLPIIEDVAQAFGGTINGQPLGSFGLASVFSFRRTKILDVGHGGAVATNDQALIRAFDGMSRGLGGMPGNAQDISEDWRAEYYRAWSATKSGADPRTKFQRLPEIFEPLAMIGFDPAFANALKSGLETVPALVQARREKSDIYTRKLDDLPVTFPRTAGESAPWRQIGHIAPPARTAIVERMRARQFDISEWYPNLGPQFGSGASLANADQFEHSVINLWLDEATDTDRVNATADALREAIQQNLERVGA
jgi:dTDP-4-amino-4,6-dideoxygalactose transaminase